MCLSFAIGALGDVGRDWFKYDRTAISDGELWRLVTAHFAHLSNAHLLLNMLGFGLTWLLVGANYRVRDWLLVVFVSLLLQSLGFWFLDPEMSWYVGMSGLLHGLMLAGAISGFKTERIESVVLCMLVVAKLIYEQWFGPLPGSESTSGGTVVVNAHLYGAIGGVVAALLLWRRELWRRDRYSGPI